MRREKKDKEKKEEGKKIEPCRVSNVPKMSFRVKTLGKFTFNTTPLDVR